VRPPEWSETGLADSAFIAHSPTCGERWQKLHYGFDRRRVLLDQMKRASHRLLRVASVPQADSETILSVTFDLHHEKTYLCYHADAYY
jgi:hypothetical protein